MPTENCPQGSAPTHALRANSAPKAYSDLRADSLPNCPPVTDEIGWRFAGLADGESHLGITISGRTRAGFRCVFVIALRDDDRDFLEFMYEQIGLGDVYTTPRYALSSRPGAKPLVRWEIRRKAEVLQLVALLDRYPLLSKKAREYVIWRQGVMAWIDRDWQQMAELKAQLSETRAYPEAA